MKKFVLVVLLFSTCHISAQNFSAVNVEGAYPALYFKHTLAQGDNFLSLARLYNVSPNAIASLNSLRLGANLTAAEVLKIPVTTTNFLRSPQPSGTNNYYPVTHVATENETISSVSRKYGVTDSLIQHTNSLTGKMIKAGNKLIVGYLKIRKEQSTFPQSSAKTDTQTLSTNQTPKSIVGTDTTPIDLKELDSDKLFEEARRSAFDKKDYATALRLCYLALAKSPDYSDIRIFTGRIYTWTDKVDSAISHFDYVVKNDAGNRDVYVAYTDLLYWNDKYNDALEIVEKGLSNNPTSKDLSIRKVKILKALKRPAEAQVVLEALLKNDRSNTEARALLDRNKDEILKNKIGGSYEYTYFDKQFSDPWHIGSLDYSRQTKLGSVGGHINYANRFKSGGLQYELEAYPNISKRFYSYVSAAYSGKVGVFPKYRGGFSLYSILPKSMEGELGIRYLYFSDATIIYTAALSKYYKSWLFTARSYITPGDNDVSQTYNLATRYYYGGANDYFSLTIGRGISPDDRPVSILLDNKQYKKLLTLKAALGYRHEFKKKYVLTIDAGWMNQEFRPETKGNQLSTGISYQVRF
jgi:YaiO family outer membrane protein